MEQARGFLKKIIEFLKKPELRILPGQLAFFLVLSLIPLVALIGTIASFLSIPSDLVKEVLVNVAPKEVTGIIANVISGSGIEFNFNRIVFMVVAFVLATNGTYSIIITSNEIYKQNSKSWVKRRIKAILMGLLLITLFLLLLIMPIWGETILQNISTTISPTKLTSIIYNTYKLIQYPLILVILYYGIKTMYIIAPDEKIKSTTTVRGALFTTIGWVLASEIYSFYVEKISNYDLFYGSVSNVIILLLWVYILSYIFVLGMIFNASNYKPSEEKKIKDSTENITDKKVLEKPKNDV